MCFKRFIFLVQLSKNFGKCGDQGELKYTYKLLNELP
jgi:hypothetical protein